jgi:hypothetical protein
MIEAVQTSETSVTLFTNETRLNISFVNEQIPVFSCVQADQMFWEKQLLTSLPNFLSQSPIRNTEKRLTADTQILKSNLFSKFTLKHTDGKLVQLSKTFI